MPSLGIHLIVLDEVVQSLRRSNDPKHTSLAGEIEDHPAFASLGAIGPDLIYYVGTSGALSAAVADVFHGMNRISNVLTKAANIADKVGGPNSSHLLRSLVESVQMEFGSIQQGLLTSVVKVNDAVASDHIFKQSAAQREQPETDWNWGDLLHDRISGQFANEIEDIAKAKGNPAWRVYAMAYKTHLATDFVGHAYVNSVVGGPARGFNMRHTVAEKFMDAYAFSTRGRDINTSQLHTRVEPLLDSSELLALADMLSRAITEVANSKDMLVNFVLPAAPTANDIKDAFTHMYKLFRLVTEDAFVPPPQGPMIELPPLPGGYGSITNAVGGIPAGGAPKRLSDWLKLLIFSLLGAPAVLTDILRLLSAIASQPSEYPAEAALYLLQSFMYSMYRQVRWFLVVSGIAFPCRDELTSPLGQQFVTTRGSYDENYPRQPKIVSSPTVVQFRGYKFLDSDLEYLEYPTRPCEQPHTQPSPYPNNANPNFFINQLGRDDVFLSSWLTAKTPDEVRQLVKKIQVTGGGQPIGGFGNAVDLSILFMGQRELAEHINLDSDRGYGYRLWKCQKGTIIAGSLIGEMFY